jgi:hypothetical protein
MQLKPFGTGGILRMLCLLLTATHLSPSSFAQGTLLFNTHIPGVVEARVFCPDGVTPAGPIASAQLWGGASPDQLAPLHPVTTFGTGPMAGFVVVPSEPVIVPGVPEGGTAWVQLRAWNNPEGNRPWQPDHEQAASNIIPVGPLGGDRLPPATLAELHSFGPVGGSFCIPEAGSIWLFALVLGALLLVTSKRPAARER